MQDVHAELDSTRPDKTRNIAADPDRPSIWGPMRGLMQPNGVLLLLRNASGGTSHTPGSVGNDSRDGRA